MKTIAMALVWACVGCGGGGQAPPTDAAELADATPTDAAYCAGLPDPTETQAECSNNFQLCRLGCANQYPSDPINEARCEARCASQEACCDGAYDYCSTLPLGCTANECQAALMACKMVP